MKKAQAAIEYLIILAVVIVIALIVVGVLGGIPGIAKTVSERQSQAYWQGADIGITRYVIKPTGATFVLKNNRNFRATIGDMVVGATSFSINRSLLPGLELTTTTSAVTCTPVGDVYSYDVNISYTDDRRAPYKLIGTTQLVGTCQP